MSLAWDGGCASGSDNFLRYKYSPGQNIDGKKKDKNNPSHILRSSFKTSEDNVEKKVSVCRKVFCNLEAAEKCTTAANSIIQMKGTIFNCRTIL